MKKQNIIIYASLLIGGILLGWLLFGGDSKAEKEDGKTAGQAIIESTQFWTCSMHPQIHLPKPGDCPICGMDLIPEQEGGNSNPLVLEMTEDAIKLMNIQTTIVGGKSSSQQNDGKLRLSGKIIADETTTASIVSHIPGRIEKLYISFTGEQVYRGQRIATIYSPNLITAQKELLEAQKIKEINPSLFEATLNKLKYWRITEKQINEVLTEQKVKESFGIYAEHSGVVSNKRVSVGDHLMEGGVLFDIQNLNKLWGVFDVYEANLQDVKVGDAITFTTPSVSGEEFKAKISFIDPVINPKTRAASIRIEIPNKNKKLKPEMFITGILAGNQSSINSEKSSQIIIPKSAVMWTGTRSVVYVKKPDVKIPSFEYREVVLGNSFGNSYVVTDGLKSGEEIVTKGAFVIDASAQLNNQASMMNQLVEKDNAKTSSTEVPDYASSTPPEFVNQLAQVTEQYLQLKDGLTKDDAQKTSQAGKKLNDKLKDVDMLLLKGDAHVYWMNQLKMLQAHSRNISETEDIEKQRKNFEMLSTSMINSVKAFGVPSNELFVEFCPMAADNKGAFWISSESEIVNPYFGKQMLTCGSVEDTIK